MNKQPGISRKIVIIGAGSIVKHAHLPAYKLAGFSVAGIFDLDINKAEETATQFCIPVVYDTLKAALNQIPEKVIFDLAVPPGKINEILSSLPNGAVVLIQKPMGENLQQAREIAKICRHKKIVAGLNFQLRYAPFIVKARELIRQGLIGQLCDIEINVNVHTPWQMWDFLFQAPRLEILYHSIHYIDLVRSLFGNPVGMYAKTVKYPGMESLASVRSNIMMDYDNFFRANILTNHCHYFGAHHQQSYIKLEGTTGAIKIKMGVLMNYPQGEPDVFEYCTLIKNEPPKWITVPLNGSWFPHAFIGSMNEMMKAANGNIKEPDNSVEDALFTMACVEAAYVSSKEGGVKLNQILNTQL